MAWRIAILSENGGEKVVLAGEDFKNMFRHHMASHIKGKTVFIKDNKEDHYQVQDITEMTLESVNKSFKLIEQYMRNMTVGVR